jgi:hypothetical protein
MYNDLERLLADLWRVVEKPEVGNAVRYDTLCLGVAGGTCHVAIVATQACKT